MHLSQEKLKELLDYNPETGIFTWRMNMRGPAKKGMVAGNLNKKRVEIRIKGIMYQAHRLAWLYQYGEWPKGEIDHINCDPSDNKIINLRLSSRSENCCNKMKQSNNTSGYKGVSLHKPTGKWDARIKHNGKQKCLGLFPTKELAYRAYCEEAVFLHKEFARTK